MISRVGAASAEGTTITIPSGHRVGDVIIIWAFRDGSVTNPTVPAGWTSISATIDGTSCSASVGYKIATSNSETSGTWTNATGLVCMVYRGQLIDTSASPWGSTASGNGTTNTVTYNGRGLANSGVIGSSWWIAFASHVNVDTSIETAPTNNSTGGSLTLATNTVGATAEYA